jgi:ACS family hexuronate transporter-like MFS transporter
VCALLFLATTLNYMDRIALNQMAVRIQTALQLDDFQYGLLESGFSFSFAIGAIVAGVIVDRVSVRWVYPLAVLGWSAAGFLTGFASGFATLLACRVMLGLFEAANWPCGIRTTRAMLRPGERSLGNSLFQSGTAVGAVVTPFLILLLLRWADPQEPFRNAVMAVTGGTYAAVTDTPTDTWRLPFRVIGLIGVGWVALWFLTVPRQVLVPQPETAAEAGAARYRDIFRDRRFWAVLIVALAVNVAWHTYRPWLPKYLQQKRGLSEVEMSAIMTWYYLLSDVGSWTVGGVTLVLIRRGHGQHLVKVLMFAACAALALISVLVPLAPTGWALTATVLLFGFACLGLFPTYYALTQEVSARHQGKVSGTLGACSHMFLSLAVYPTQGWVVKTTGSYDGMLAVAGVFPLLALVALIWLRPLRRDRNSPPGPEPGGRADRSPDNMSSS